MPLSYNGTTSLTNVIYNGITVNKVIFNGSTVYTKEFGKETNISPLSVSRCRGAGAATVGNYAIFAGGRTRSYNSSCTPMVDVYDNSLVHTIPPSVLNSGRDTEAITIGGRGFFFGFDSATSKHVTDIYDQYLTHSTATGVKVYPSFEVATVGDYIIIFEDHHEGPGSALTDSSQLYIYSSSLTRINPTLSYEQYTTSRTAVSFSNYAMFAGGTYQTPSMSYPCDSDDVIIFDSSLTMSEVTLSSARESIGTATIGNYALFAGGRYHYEPTAGANGWSYLRVVDALDSSLTKVYVSDLKCANSSLCGTNSGGHAIFVGGQYLPNQLYTYDTSLTQTYKDGWVTMNRKRKCSSATNLGCYALFAGGDGIDTTDVVEVFSS